MFCLKKNNFVWKLILIPDELFPKIIVELGLFTREVAQKKKMLLKRVKKKGTNVKKCYWQ